MKEKEEIAENAPRDLYMHEKGVLNKQPAGNNPELLNRSAIRGVPSARIKCGKFREELSCDIHNPCESHEMHSR